MAGFRDALARQGVRVVVVFFSARVGDVARYLDRETGNGIVVLPVPRLYRWWRRRLHGYRSPAYAPAARPAGTVRRLERSAHVLAPHLSTPVRELTRELRRWRCRAILCQEYEYFRFDTCVTLGRLLRIPVFATFQGADHEHNALSRAVKKQTIRRCAALFIAADTEIARVRDVYGEHLPPIVPVLNPVDVDGWGGAVRERTRAAYGLEPSTRVAVWHGRINVYTKGLDLLLQAWEQVCDERPGRDLRLMILGAGSDGEEFARLLAASTAANVRWFDQYVTDRAIVRDFLAAGDVFVFPSRLEGFPVAPLEAMCCGLPVVGTDASGVPDILRAGEASGGIVVRREDVAGLARALGRLLDDPDLSAELGRRASRRVREACSLDSVGRQLRGALLPAGADVATGPSR
jgi:glycosyltransferase involved in cell wall biosynthesis